MLTDKSHKASADSRLKPGITVSSDDDGNRLIALNGQWMSHSVGLVDKQMRALAQQKATHTIIDITDITRLDTAGAWLIERLRQTANGETDGQGGQVTLHGMHESWQPLMDEVGKSCQSVLNPPKNDWKFSLNGMLEAIGRGVAASYDDFIMAMNVLGSTIRGSQSRRTGGLGINLAAITHQIQMMGVGALPIIILMSTIVGAIIAQQGAFQLRYFGAEIFVVDLVGILVLRELGVLLTAIMIAGRSGSAITAEIGSMKMREEIDALKVIGLNPISVLIFPRLVALVIILPLLTVVADLAALIGAAAITWSYSSIPPEVFIARLHDSVALNTYLAGMIKAPFMAMIIGVMASVEGMKVGGSAESLGRRVTASVVKSIFVVIVVDGLFAIFYAAIDF